MGFLDYKGLERFLKNSREEFAQKSHTHDERYYTEYEIDNKLSKKSDIDHIHDNRYYTEAEVDGKLEKKSSTDHTHDLSKLISNLSIGTSTTLNDAVQIITQDTDTANQKYYRRPLAVLWDYIKSKADSVYSAIGHNHKIQNLEDYTTRVWDATIVRQADTVLASPQDKDGIATFRKLDKNDVGLENVDNTFDKDKNVATARGISVGDPVLATGVENSEITGKMNDNKSLGTAATNAGVLGLRNALDFRWYDTHWQIGNLRSGDDQSAGFGFAFKNRGENSFSLKARILTDGTYEGNISGNAATAGTANTLSGFSPRSSQTWGVQTGTFVHGEGDNTGGDFAFRRDCPNAGQVSMVLDGRFYQNGGQYRVLDTSDEPNLNVNSANFAKETYINQYKIVNLTDLDQNTWYPVTGTNIPYNGLIRFKCNVQLNSGSKPSWSTHSGGFTAVVDILYESSGWGTTCMQGMVLVNDQLWINDSNKPPVGYQQMSIGSIPVWWLRGGGSYRLATDYDCTWTIQKSPYTNNGQTVSPTTTYPGVYVNRSTIVADLDGNAKTATNATNASNSDKWAGLSWRHNHNTTDTWIPVVSDNAFDYILKHEISADKLPLTGGTMSGALNFANGTWNLVGDDAYMGDRNIGGSFCIMGANDTTRLALVNKDNQGDYAILEYGGGNLNFNKKLGANITGHADGDLALSGGTMSGALNFANGTWNLVGDDAYMGDRNIGGSFCIMGANDTTRLALVNKDNQGDYAILEYGGGNLNFNKKLGANITGHADGDLALSGGTMSGQIIKSTGGSWIGDRDRAAIRSSYAGDWSYGAVAAMSTKNGYWTMGNLGGNESLIFNYSPDSNYTAGKNETYQVYLPAQAGTIITSATIGNQTVNRAEYLGNDAAYMRMHWNGQGGQPTWLWGGNDASNMYVWNPSNFSVNYANSAGNGVTASGKTGAGIYYVRFGDGTQMCWGYYNESDHNGSTSFPVAFNNAEYSLSLTITVSSNNAPYITGRSTTGFSYARHGTSYNNIQWIAVGTWK